MSRRYTAQDMRETADDFENYSDMDESVIADMLRQAADDMERDDKREKKYEYAERYDDGVVSSSHDSEMIDRTLIFDDSDVVRREVGEWEEVVDGKEEKP